ncbi:hypothetical protein J6590_106989, partial [Homalodisca vitripennis]
QRSAQQTGDLACRIVTAAAVNSTSVESDAPPTARSTCEAVTIRGGIPVVAYLDCESSQIAIKNQYLSNDKCFQFLAEL